MGVNFKEACTYIFKDKSWKSKFVILSALIFVPTIILYLTNNFIAGFIFGLFTLGFNILLTNNLLNDTEPVLPDFNIKKILKTGIKYWGVLFTILAIYLSIAIVCVILESIVMIITTLVGKLYFASSTNLFNQIMVVQTCLFIGVTLILAAFTQLLFSENFSYKEAFNIKRIFKAFAANWKMYLLLFVLIMFIYLPLEYINEISYIYDNKSILVLFTLLYSLISSFIYFVVINLFAQAYKLSLAKIERDDPKLEQLNRKFNGFDYKAIGLIVVVSAALISTLFVFPISKHSSLGRYISANELLKKQLQHKVKVTRPFNYEINHDLGCRPERYDFQKTTLFPIIKNGKMGYIDKTGNVMINPQFAFADDFHEGLALVNIGGQRNAYSSLYDQNLKGGKYGYINTKGNIVIKPIFRGGSKFKNGKARVQLEDYKIAYIDKTWAYNNPQTYNEIKDEVKSEYHDGLSRIIINNKQGFADKHGSIIIRPDYDRVYDFDEGIARVEKNGKMGVLNKKGNTIIDIKYDYLSEFREGLALVVLNKKYGFIDKTGKIVIQPQFKDACDFSEGYADVNINDKIGYIDKTGKLTIKPQYDGNYGFVNGIAPVKIGKKWGYIDKKGKYIWKPTN